jgi:hypothetical protein
VVGYNVNNIDDWNTHRSHLVHAYGADYDARLIGIHDSLLVSLLIDL